MGTKPTGTVYEAFISSRYNCEVKEENCRRSVLPGRKFACQRPNGWCMHGEEYSRNTDCDGDGHFDHVCKSNNLLHEGYISSAQDCIDTWEEGTTGRKCEPPTAIVTKAELPYRLVKDSGSCVPADFVRGHTLLGGDGICFKSHENWPS